MALTADGCVQFTRHSADVLLNFQRLRSRDLLTDVTVQVDGRRFPAHKAVLVACSGFFYSVFMQPENAALGSISLAAPVDARGFSVLLDFMYSSCLQLSDALVHATLRTAAYLQMEHVAEACQRYLTSRTPPQTPLLEYPAPPALFRGISTSSSCHVYVEPRAAPEGGPAPREGVICGPRSPLRSDCHPDSPPESGSSRSAAGRSPPTAGRSPPTAARNWKKYKFIVLNQQSRTHTPTHTQEEGGPALGGPAKRTDEATTAGKAPESPEPLHSGPETPQRCSEQMMSDGSNSGSESLSFWGGCDSKSEGEDSLKDGSNKPYKCDCCPAAFRYKGNLASHKTVHTGAKPYRCDVCGAQFNRPANLKTHGRIHSGEKPYQCDTCGARFVQVAHLRAHVLIHTGEKPYPCDICGTHFRHLQTLKSHMRIHTGEKPYHCEKCDLHFRHKSQLRLHLRQKHGAVTNTKRRPPSTSGTVC